MTNPDKAMAHRYQVRLLLELVTHNEVPIIA